MEGLGLSVNLADPNFNKHKEQRARGVIGNTSLAFSVWLLPPGHRTTPIPNR